MTTDQLDRSGPGGGPPARRPGRSPSAHHSTDEATHPASHHASHHAAHAAGHRWAASFVRQYGWRAYALPVLVVVTVVSLIWIARPGTGSTGPEPGRPGGADPMPPVATGVTSLKTDAPAPNSGHEALVSDALPDGPAYTVQGTGTFAVIPGSGPVVGSGALHRYTIEVENGVTGVDLGQFATMVQAVLSDPRSWTGHGSGVSLQRVDSGPVDFHVTLTSVMTVRQLCGYDIPIETSCFAPSANNRVLMNVARWVRGDNAYPNNIDLYRTYMINHENGHALGHQHSHQCLSNGLAPVMMQQTIGLKSVTGQMCQDNVWPFPDGAADAPGREEPDTPQNDESVLIGAH